jgi:hypothetical protein
MTAVRLLAALVFAAATQCAAAPFAIQVGEARIGLDAPPGFADTAFTGSPRLQDAAEALTSPSNRVLLFALTDGDLRRFTQGDAPDLKRFMIVSTPKEFERERVGPSAFGRMTADLLREGGGGAGDAAYLAFLDKQPAGKAATLAELGRQPDTVSLLQGTRLPTVRRDDKPTYLLSTLSLLLVRGKALQLAVYSAYESPADVEWIRGITARWIEDLKRLNSR